MTPEERGIAMKSMKKAKKEDTEDILDKEEAGETKIPPKPTDWPAGKQHHIEALQQE